MAPPTCGPLTPLVIWRGNTTGGELDWELTTDPVWPVPWAADVVEERARSAANRTKPLALLAGREVNSGEYMLDLSGEGSEFMGDLTVSCDGGWKHLPLIGFARPLHCRKRVPE